MKITTKITVTIERPDGSASEISQTRHTVEEHLDPKDERRAVEQALTYDLETFSRRHSLESSRLPLLP